MSEKRPGVEVSRTHHAFHQGFPLRPNDKVSTFHKLMRGRFGVVIFLLLTIVLTVLPTLFISWPLFIFLVTGIVRRDLVRSFVNWSFGIWLYMESYFFDKMLGTHVRVFGHPGKFTDRCLIVMNHRCHFDWMFFFPVVCKQGDPSKLMAVLKYAGKAFPILGWAMQIRNFFFMSRKWSKDERELKWKLNFLKATNSKYQILMFPEGTDLNPFSCSKSNKFADEKNYPRYDYVLHPKVTGFVYTMKVLKEYKIDTVYDITVGYPDIFAATEVDMLAESKVPREIHYHIACYDVSKVPETDNEMEEWLKQRWKEKEERLRLFYTHREFRELSVDQSGDRCTGNITNGAMTTVRSPEVCNKLLFFPVLQALVFCVVNVLLYGYLCWTFWYVALLVLLLLSGTLYISLRTEGADYMVMRHSNNKEFHKLIEDTCS